MVLNWGKQKEQKMWKRQETIKAILTRNISGDPQFLGIGMCLCTIKVENGKLFSFNVGCKVPGWQPCLREGEKSVEGRMKTANC